MNRIIFLFSWCLITCLTLSADDTTGAAINLQHNGPNNHFDQPIPADQPEAYYNHYTQVIIIDGGGEVAYYDVEIESLTTWLTVISTQVSGTYDTIDVSSLAAGEYCITITSPTGHEFEGFFNIE